MRPRARAVPRPAAPARPKAPVPAVRQSAPAPVAAMQPQGQHGVAGGLMSTVASGMAFGTGSAIAHRAVDSIMGGRESHAPQEAPAASAAAAADPVPMATEYSSGNACAVDLKAFRDVSSSAIRSRVCM